MTGRRVALVVVLTAAVVLLIAGLVTSPDAPPPGPGSGYRVVVLGVDGLDWFLLARYVEEGRMPAVGTLLRSGVSGELAPEIPAVPEVSWNAMMAGVAPSGSDVPGRPDRRYGAVPRVAELVAAAGGTPLVVNWPAAWPAARSDWPLVAGFAPRAESHVNELAPAIFPGSPGHASSPELESEIFDIAARTEERAAASFESIVALDEADPSGWEDHLTAARWSHLADLSVLDVGVRLLAREEPDLAMIHIAGLDAVSHRFLAPAAPEFFSELPDEALRFEEVLPRYYEFVDQAVWRIMRLVDDETIFILCSAYGFHPSLDVPRISGTHADAPPGVFIVRGPRIQPLPEAASLHARDVAPTVLAMLGVEIPDDIDGRVVLEALPAGLARERPPEFGPAPAPDFGTTQEPPELAAAREAAARRLSELRVEVE